MVFPGQTLTRVEERRRYRRYHLHETHVQKAIKRAVGKARFPSAHRPIPFATVLPAHLLQANYDIRTIQELLGHSDVQDHHDLHPHDEKRDHQRGQEPA